MKKFFLAYAVAATALLAGAASAEPATNKVDVCVKSSGSVNLADVGKIVGGNSAQYAKLNVESSPGQTGFTGSVHRLNYGRGSVLTNSNLAAGTANRRLGMTS